MPTLEASSEDVRIYEIAVLYPFPLNQKEEKEVLSRVEEVFEEAKGKQVSKDVWGRRGLAYPIKGATEANIIIYYYELDPSTIKEIDTQFKILPGVLRHLIVKPPKGYQIVSYAEKYEKWLKSRKDDEQKAAEEREEALKKKVLSKAKRVTKKTEEKPVKEASKEDISKKLDKIISDDDLDI